MKHHHTGPKDQACDGCLDEANSIYRAQERLRTVAGLLILIGLVIGGMVLLSIYLTKHGSHIG